MSLPSPLFSLLHLLPQPSHCMCACVPGTWYSCLPSPHSSWDALPSGISLSACLWVYALHLGSGLSSGSSVENCACMVTCCDFSQRQFLLLCQAQGLPPPLPLPHHHQPQAISLYVLCIFVLSELGVAWTSLPSYPKPAIPAVCWDRASGWAGRQTGTHGLWLTFLFHTHGKMEGMAWHGPFL